MHLETVYRRGPDGVMLLAGHDVRELVERFGSPLLVLLEEVVRFNCRAYRRALADNYPHGRVYYAGKAFLCTGLCRLLAQEDMYLDVVSAGELHTARRAGFDPARILFHGNAKTPAELELAVELGVGRIVVDNQAEIERLEQVAGSRGRRVDVLIRVTPGVKPSTHHYVQTGQLDSKFGFNLAGGAARRAAERVLGSEWLRLVGLHCHIGSQVFSSQPFQVAARAVLELYAALQAECGARLEELNLGGGLGIRYLPDDYPPSVADHMGALAGTVLAECRRLGIAPPLLGDEPGRSIIGRAGVTLYTVQSVKRIPGVRDYASVDGGMNDNPRYALYGARHQILAATKLDRPAEQRWSISGRCCESGDMLGHDLALPELEPGDLLAVMATGAYTQSMASNYNRVPRPAVVLAGPHGVEELVARESLDDLVRLDRVPSWLQEPGS